MKLIFLIIICIGHFNFSETAVKTSLFKNDYVYTDLFFPPNTLNNSKFYVIILDGKSQLIYNSDILTTNSPPIQASFNKISNIVSKKPALGNKEIFFICALDSPSIWILENNTLRSLESSNVNSTGLRCYTDTLEKYLTIAPIGFNKIFLYDMDQTFMEIFDFGVNNVLLAWSAKSDRVDDQMYYAVVTDKIKKINKVKILKQENGKLNEVFNFEFTNEEMILFNMVEVSSNSFTNCIIVFTYDKNSSNCRIFNIDTWGVIVKYEKTFPLYAIDQILDVSFVEFTDIIVFRVLIGTNLYYGAIDLSVNKQILYMVYVAETVSWIKFMKINSDYIAIFQKGNNMITMNCALTSDKNTGGNTNCYIDCLNKAQGSGYNTSTDLSISNFQCTQCQSQKMVLYSRWCQNSCPSNLPYDVNGVCQLCQSPYLYYDQTKSLCVEKCPDFYGYNENKVCIKCSLMNYFYDTVKRICVTSCPNNFVSDPVTGACYSCKSIGKFYCGGKTSCCDSCPEVYTNDNICYTCKSIIKFFSKSTKSCIDQCPTNAVVDVNANSCDICQERSPSRYYMPSLNTCVSTCPEYNLSTADNICYTCKSKNLYYYYNECRASCPEGNEITGENICISCKNSNKFLLKGKCVNSCPINYLYDSFNVCYTCKERNNNYYDQNSKQCVDKCTPDSQIDEINTVDQRNLICTPCGSINKLLSQNKCVDSCPENNIIKDKTICYSCAEHGEFFVIPDNKCVTKCENFWEIDTTKKTCLNCIGKNMFFYDSKCVDKCPLYYIYDTKTNVCFNCKKDRNESYLQNGECVPVCREGSKVDKINYVCMYCGDSNPPGFYLPSENKCVEKCPEDYLYSDSRKCYQCSETKKYLYRTKSQCLNECPNFCTTDNFICNCCKENTPPKVLWGGTCNDACPPNTVIFPEGVCYSCKDNNKYRYDNVCKEKCEPYMAVDEKGKVCNFCKANKDLFLYKNECIKACPEYSIWDINNVCNKCSDNKQYYLDKKMTSSCEDKCPKNSLISEEKKYCKSCVDFNLWLFDDKECTEQCNYCKSEGNICKYCNECQRTDKYKYITQCVKPCPAYTYLNSEIKGECLHCDPNLFYYDDGKSDKIPCVEKCPQDHYYETIYSNKICKKCDNYIYKNKCIETCPYPFGINKKKQNIECISCKKESLVYYENTCIEPQDNIPERTKCPCSENGKCVNETCKCDSNYYGKFCEMKNNTIESFFTIEPKYPPVNLDKINVFKISNFTDFSNFSYINWTVNNLNLTDNYLTGRKEKELKLKHNSLMEGLNKIILELSNDNDESNDNFKKINTTLELTIPKPIDKKIFDCKVNYTDNDNNTDFGIAMKTLVVINCKKQKSKSDIIQRVLNDNNETKYYYKFSYVDENNGIHQLSGDFSSISIFSGYIPLSNKTLVEVMDNRQQTAKILIDLKIRKDTEYDHTLSDCLEGHSMNERMLEINNYIDHKDPSSKDVVEIKAEITKAFDILMNNRTKDISHSTVLATFNQLVNKISTEIKKTCEEYAFDDIKNINDLMTYFTIGINSQKDPYAINRIDLKSYYKSMDKVFDLFSDLKYANDDKMKAEQLQLLKKSIFNVNSYVSRGMDINERVLISTDYFDILIERPSENQKLIELEEIDKSNQKDDDKYEITNVYKKETCSSTTMLCVNEDDFKELKNGYKFTNRGIDFTDLALITVNINNTFLYKGTNQDYRPFSTTTMATSLYITVKNISLNNPEYFKPDINLFTSSFNSTQVNYTTCVLLTEMNLLKTCETYYDYETYNRTMCKCNSTGDVFNVYNYTLATIAKVLQYPVWNIEKVNTLSMSLVFGSLSIVFLFNLILLCSDYYDDRNFLKSNHLDDHQIIRNEFRDLTSLCQTNMFSFALYVTMYIYPFLSVFTAYNYDQPRFVRFSVEFLSILMSLFFSLLPYANNPNEYRQIVIDERNIKTQDWSIDNLPYRVRDIVSTLLYTVFATIIMTIIMKFFAILMRWGEMMVQIWKYRENIIKKYVNRYLVQSLRLPKQWRMLRMRILAFSALCGKWIQKKRGEFIKKEEIQRKNYFKELYDKQTDDTKENILRSKLIKDNKNKEISIEMREKCMGQPIPSHGPTSIDIHSRIKSNTQVRSTSANSSKDDVLYMTKAENLSLNILYAEEIKNKFKKLNTTSKLFKRPESIYSNVKKYDSKKLRMFRVNELKYANLTPNNILLHIFRKEKINILMTLFTIILLALLYFILYTYLIVVVSDIYNRYQYYIIKVWLVPSILKLFLVKFMISYGLNLLNSYLLFRHYAMRETNKIISLLYTLLIPEHVIYIYRIRNLITKYENELKEVNSVGFGDERDTESDIRTY